MPVVIQFDSENDHEEAIDVLLESGETYGGFARGCIVVSEPAIRALRAQGIGFRVIGEKKREEESSGPRP